MTVLATQLRGLQHHVITGAAAPATLFLGTRTASRAARLKVYREAYYRRLAEAMTATYPALQRLLGDRQFAQLVRRYVDAHPSQHYSVRWFGHRLATWLRHAAPYASQPALAELARWEWQLAQSFDAADAPILDRATLANMPDVEWPGIRLHFHASLGSLKTAWNVVDQWRALTQERRPPPLARLARVQHWAIWRRDLEVLFQPLPELERTPLRVARRGGSLADLCASAPDPEDEADAAHWAAQMLARWLGRGWIVGLRAGN